MDIERLRRLSAQGEIERQKRIELEQLEQQRREEEGRQAGIAAAKNLVEQQEQKAAARIREIPQMVERAAANGFRKCEVLQVPVDPAAKERRYTGIFVRSVSPSIVERVAEDSRIVATRVYAFLKDSGLNPRLSFLEGHTADEEFKTRDGNWERWGRDTPGTLWIHAQW